MNKIWILEETDVILEDNFDEFITGKRCYLSREKALDFMNNFSIKLLYDEESDLKDTTVKIIRESVYNKENGQVDQWGISFYDPIYKEEYTTHVRLTDFNIEE